MPRSDRPIVFFYPLTAPARQPFDVYIVFIDQRRDVCNLNWRSLQLVYNDIDWTERWFWPKYNAGEFPVHCAETGVAVMIPRVCFPPGMHHIKARMATIDSSSNIGEGEIKYCVASGSPSMSADPTYRQGSELDSFELKICDPAGMENAQMLKAWLRKDAGSWEDITPIYCLTPLTVSGSGDQPRCCNKEATYASMALPQCSYLGNNTNEFCFCYANSLGLQAEPAYLRFDRPPPQTAIPGLTLCPQSRAFTPEDSIEPFARVLFTAPDGEEFSLRVRFELTWWWGGTVVHHWQDDERNTDEKIDFSSSDFDGAIDIHSQVFRAEAGMPPGRYRLVAGLYAKRPEDLDFGDAVVSDHAIYIVEAQPIEEPVDVQITVDLWNRAQRMVGFGGFMGPDLEKCGQSTMETVCELIFSDLGSTILRIGSPTSTVLHTDLYDNSVSFDLIKCAFKWGAERLIVVTCSPPAQWKNTGNMWNTKGSVLVDEYFENFVNWIADFICLLKTETGYEVSVWSVQNEPDVICPYPGALYYDPLAQEICADLSEVVRIAGPIFRFRGLQTLVAVSDASCVTRSRMLLCSGCFPQLLDDENTRSHLDVITTHQYNLEVRDRFVGDQEKEEWGKLRDRAGLYEKPVWQTELAIELNEKPAGIWTALINAEYLHMALVHGDCCAWLYFNLYWSKEHPDSPVTIGETGVCVNKVYYALKQYFRYIRPGMVRVRVTPNDGASSLDAELLVSAFTSPDRNCLTLVVINRSTNQYHLKVEWLNLLTDISTCLAHFMTTDARDCERVGTVRTDDEYLLVCAKSINTFTNVGV